MTEKIIIEPIATAHVAIFVKQRVINAVEKKLLSEPLLTMDILSPLDCSSSGSVGTTLIKCPKPGTRVIGAIMKTIKGTVTAWWSYPKSTRNINVHRLSPARRPVAWLWRPPNHLAWAQALTPEAAMQTGISPKLTVTRKMRKCSFQ